MKFYALFAAGCVLSVIAWIGIGGSDLIPLAVDSAGKESLEVEGEVGDATASRIRSRADSAFAGLGQARTRFESRIGPQPWPRDLPTNWPTPSHARVLADTKHHAGGRLLLLDLSESLEGAMSYYRVALAEQGYRAEPDQRRADRHMLRTRRDGSEAILRFFAGKHATRIEILFRDKSRS